jgi:hypothetical protein
MESKIKLVDCEPIDLVIGMLTRQGEGDGQVARLARVVGLHIVHAGDPDQLAELVFREIVKRY